MSRRKASWEKFPWKYADCPHCGKRYAYLRHKPMTCGAFDCLRKQSDEERATVRREAAARMHVPEER